MNVRVVMPVAISIAEGSGQSVINDSLQKRYYTGTMGAITIFT